MAPNPDIGFIAAGQEAEIKIDTFNFTRYGLIHGVVRDVSRDAVIREKPTGCANGQFRGPWCALREERAPRAGAVIRCPRGCRSRNHGDRWARCAALAPNGSHS